MCGGVSAMGCVVLSRSSDGIETNVPVHAMIFIFGKDEAGGRFGAMAFVAPSIEDGLLERFTLTICSRQY